MREVKIKSAIPIYMMGGAWAAYAALFPLYRLQDFIAPVVLGGLFYAAGSKLIPPKVKLVEEPPPPIHTGDPEMDQVLMKGREHVASLQELYVKIQNKKLSQEIQVIAQITKQIFEYIEKKPQKLRQIRQFTNYYLPTTVKLLRNYQELDLQPTKVENMTEAMKSIEAMMETVIKAFKEVLDDLFAGHTMNITVDAQVLEQVMHQEGIDDDTLKL